MKDNLVDKIILLPSPAGMVKIQKSDKKDETKPSIIELKKPYRKHDKLRFQHVLKTPGQVDKKDTPVVELAR